jgi:hypothetical protein
MSTFLLSIIATPLMFPHCCVHFEQSQCWEQFDGNVLGSSMVKCWSVWWWYALQWQCPRLFDDDMLSSSSWCVGSLMTMSLALWWQCANVNVLGSLMIMY